ncbi:hypothetical protein HK096_006244, partial [Nowakowskiella sp. JEL0078]
MFEAVEDPLDEAYLLYCSLLPTRRSASHLPLHNASVNQKLPKLSFALSDEICIQISQQRNLLSKTGVTGSVVWDSCVFLSKLLASLPETSSTKPPTFDSDAFDFWPPKLKNSSCLELGSGTGLLSITLASSPALQSPALLVVTDTQEMVSLAFKNLLLNSLLLSRNKSTTIRYIDVNGTDHRSFIPPPSKGFKSQANGSMTTLNIVVTELEWGNTKMYENLKSDVGQDCIEGFDYIFAADCIYNEVCIDLFVLTLLIVCRASKDPRPTVVYIAQELRSEEVHSLFVGKMLESGFRLWRMMEDKMNVGSAVVFYVA